MFPQLRHSYHPNTNYNFSYHKAAKAENIITDGLFLYPHFSPHFFHYNFSPHFSTIIFPLSFFPSFFHYHFSPHFSTIIFPLVFPLSFPPHFSTIIFPSFFHYNFSPHFFIIILNLIFTDLTLFTDRFSTLPFFLELYLCYHRL